MAGDLHVQISIKYNEQQRMVRYHRLPEPYQGRHDYTADQVAEPPLTLHLYWCPNLPGEATRDALLPGLEQFVRRTIAETTLVKPSDTPTTNAPSRYREIYTPSRSRATSTATASGNRRQANGRYSRSHLRMFGWARDFKVAVPL